MPRPLSVDPIAYEEARLGIETRFAALRHGAMAACAREAGIKHANFSRFIRGDYRSRPCLAAARAWLDANEASWLLRPQIAGNHEALRRDVRRLMNLLPSGYQRRAARAIGCSAESVYRTINGRSYGCSGPQWRANTRDRLEKLAVWALGEAQAQGLV